MDWGDLVLVLVALNSITSLMPDMAAAQNPLPFLPPVFSKIPLLHLQAIDNILNH